MSSTTFNPTTNNARLPISRIPRLDGPITIWQHVDYPRRHPREPSWIRLWDASPAFCVILWHAFADFCASLWHAFAAFCASLWYAWARLWRACVDHIFHNSDNFSIIAFSLFAICNFSFLRAIGAAFIFYLAYLSLTSPSPSSSSAQPVLPVTTSSDERRDRFPLQPAIFTAMAISLFSLLAYEIATGSLLIFSLLILSLRNRRLSLIHGSPSCCLIALVFVCIYIFGIWWGIFINNKLRLPPETAELTLGSAHNGSKE